MTDLPRKIQFIFWCHFMVTLTAHVVIPFMVVYASILIFSWELGILPTGAMLGLIFCALVWGINHITNPRGYCWLTDLEQEYRRRSGTAECGNSFLPRFYAKCSLLVRGDIRSIPS